MLLADTSHRDAVRRVYPEAYAQKQVGGWWIVWSDASNNPAWLGTGDNMADAWADAARNLPQEPSDG